MKQLTFLSLVVSTIFLTFPAFTLSAKELEAELIFYGVFQGYVPPSITRNAAPINYGMGTAPQPVYATDRVIAHLGTRFGVVFVIKSEQKLKFMKLRYLTKMPDSQNNVLSSNVLCVTNQPCYAGFLFGTSDELIVGDWAFEIYDNDTKILERKFTVVPENQI